LVIKKDVSVLVLDSKYAKPVSGAQVTMNGKTAKTGADGIAHISQVPVGSWEVKTTKQYYKDSTTTQLVPILDGSSKTTGPITLSATGRVTPIAVTNKLSGTSLKNVEITAGDSTAITDSDGIANIVLPADKTTVDATFKASGYNTIAASITVAEQKDARNNFTMTPAGKVYFLSKRTGKINVMKSDLDGANPSVVVEGTGKESETQTVLLASRDWKYLALQAQRDSDTAKLYLINTATDKLSVIDEGADFTPIGWSNESFVYRVDRFNLPAWQSKRQSLKSFNAATTKITTLDDTDGGGTNTYDWVSQVYTDSYIIGDNIVYAKYWNNSVSGSLSGKKDGIYSIKNSGANKQTLKDFDATTSSYLQSKLYKPGEIYFRVNSLPEVSFYEYADGKVEPSTEVTEQNFYNTYNTYLVSPSGNKTFWSESRDGKNVMLVGDSDGANSKEFATDGSFATYGWFSDDYVLLSKNSSELYIMPSDPNRKQSPVKVTDYHKPARSFPGYGYGYGGGN
jgi:hypothetical protein